MPLSEEISLATAVVPTAGITPLEGVLSLHTLGGQAKAKSSYSIVNLGLYSVSHFLISQFHWVNV
jgi:hypothetical protein